MIGFYLLMYLHLYLIQIKVFLILPQKKANKFFLQGELIKDLATDQDASKLLYDIIFTEGLKNPRVRSEFVSKWLNTFIRYNRGNETGDHTNFNQAGETQHIAQTKERAGAVVDAATDAGKWAYGKLPFGGN